MLGSPMQALLKLYKQCAHATLLGLSTSALAMGFLFLLMIALLLTQILASGLGMMGGFLVGIVQAFAIGAYLSLVEISVVSKRRITAKDMKRAVGLYFWEVISVLFIFFIVSILLNYSVPSLLFIVIPVANLVFNPAPELIYQTRETSTGLLATALQFMLENWPEWLGAHLVAGCFLAAWVFIIQGHINTPWILDTIQLFGPWFGFILSGTLALEIGGSGLVGFFSFFLMFVFVHTFMLFRGHLFHILHTTSRRTRAWKAQL